MTNTSKNKTSKWILLFISIQKLHLLKKTNNIQTAWRVKVEQAKAMGKTHRKELYGKLKKIQAAGGFAHLVKMVNFK